MLQQMRENFTGKFALALLVMIAVSFVFFGLNYSFLGSQYAAKVDGEEIDLAVFEGAYRNAVNANPQLATAAGEVRAGVRRNILDQLIGQQLLENFLDESGYRVNDEQVMRYIREEPSFQVDGEFNMETYRTFLLERGRNPIEFENEQRAALRSRQLQLALGATAIVTPAEYRRYLNLVAEQRVVTVASIDESAVSDEITVTDEMIESFYDDNPTLYQLPETADLEYVEVRRDAVANDVEVSDKELQDHYEVSQGRFLQDEQREARHILVL
ncbi:MAG: SurA N-terminal domain-containing protein, partial [Woeseiaceae bacterium]